MVGPNTDSYSNYRANKTIQRIMKYAVRKFIIENWEKSKKQFMLIYFT